MVTPAAAGTVPHGLSGVDPAWSRRVTAVDADGLRREWHVLDNSATLSQPPVGTLLCVHGNPTWSYLWRNLVGQAATKLETVRPKAQANGNGNGRGRPSWKS